MLTNSARTASSLRRLHEHQWLRIASAVWHWLTSIMTWRLIWTKWLRSFLPKNHAECNWQIFYVTETLCSTLIRVAWSSCRTLQRSAKKPKICGKRAPKCIKMHHFESKVSKIFLGRGHSCRTPQLNVWLRACACTIITMHILRSREPIVKEWCLQFNDNLKRPTVCYWT